ncbi:hypothetical protein SIN09_12335 [Streptomyces sp. F8]|uniref:hypothetical protein n=1 Tax=Streptomyces sp. F8 TaxID=1436085 RepID=UPI0029CAE4D9|nr:hypothetical protein [Streptomyces sp. F8]MDX6760206.1 hypothetical protein [Streptomyces sp. F8]
MPRVPLAVAALRSFLAPLIALVEAVESQAISATATSHRSQASPSVDDQVLPRLGGLSVT